MIVGASVRAAAMSAIRAGYRPYGIDLFTDRDLQRIAECQRVAMADYPAGIGPLLRDAPPGPWMYTGGLENYPELIEEWRRKRELIGNGASVLAKVRDPLWLNRHVLSALSIMSIPPPGERGQWVRKPIRSAGGINIEMWDGQPLLPDTYLQRFIPGDAVSGVFIADESSCHFIGSTRQLIGETWLHAPPFRYCGNIGPRTLCAEEQQWWIGIGNTLHREAGIRGVFGVDAIMNNSGVTVIEVNPRYPASTEVLERKMGPLASVANVIGKAIYSAGRTFTFQESGPWEAELAGGTSPMRFADIPAPREAFCLGDPVITMFADGSDEFECLANLRQRAAELDKLFAN